MAVAPVGPRGERVVLVGREGCHLCAEARRLVAQEAAALGLAWVELDVDQRPDLRETLADLVPVVFVDGNQVGHWRIAPDTVRRAVIPAAAPRQDPRRQPWWRARRKGEAHRRTR